jgi:hypothetical protein
MKTEVKVRAALLNPKVLKSFVHFSRQLIHPPPPPLPLPVFVFVTFQGLIEKSDTGSRLGIKVPEVSPVSPPVPAVLSRRFQYSEVELPERDSASANEESKNDVGGGEANVAATVATTKPWKARLVSLIGFKNRSVAFLTSCFSFFPLFLLSSKRRLTLG